MLSKVAFNVAKVTLNNVVAWPRVGFSSCVINLPVVLLIITSFGAGFGLF